MLSSADAAVDEWVSIADLARLKGISKQAVSKRVKRLADEKLIEVRPHGRELHVNLAQFDKAVGETTDPAQALRNGAPEPEPETPVDPSYSKSKALRESYQAENARLDLEERRGNLTLVIEVERREMAIYRRLRDRLLGLPAKVADNLARAPDARGIRMMLDEEIRKLLDDMARELDRQAEEDEDDAA